MATLTLDFTTLGATAAFAAVAPSSPFSPVQNFGEARLQLTGAFTGTAIVEESVDGALTWNPARYVINDANLAQGFNNTITALGTYTVVLVGTTNLRLRVTAVGTGLPSVLATFVNAPPYSPVSVIVGSASSAPLSGTADAQAAAANQFIGIAALNPAGTIDRLRAVLGDALSVSAGGSSKVLVPAGLATTTIKATAGRMARAHITAAGTAVTNLQDNAVTYFVIPTGTQIGQIFDIQMPFSTNITAVGVAGSAGFTATFD